MEPQTPTERMIQGMSRANRLLWRISLPILAKICSKSWVCRTRSPPSAFLPLPPVKHRLSPATSLPSPARWRSVFDRFTGAVVLTGDVSAVEYALRQVTRTLGELMRFTACPITRT